MVTWAQLGWIGLGIGGVILLVVIAGFLLRIGAAMFTDKVD